MMGKLKRKIYAVILIIVALGLLAESIECTKEYFQYKDLVMKVDATVIDSLNYSEKSHGKLKYLYYKSTMICEWQVNGERYNQKFEDEGTYLIGDKITIDVLKDDPGKVKNISSSNAIGMTVFFLIVCLIIILMIWGDKIYKRFILKEKNDKDDKKSFYIDVEQDKIKKRRKRKRILLFNLFVVIAIFVGMTFALINESTDYYYDNNRENINVECLVISADNYSVADKEYSDISGQWEIEGQVYKKVITSLSGLYLEGETYNIEVQKDTEKSSKIRTKPQMSSMIKFLLIDLGTIVIGTILIIMWKKKEAKYR